MFIVDGERSFSAEAREPFELEFSQAIGFSIYSNSKPSVETFKSVFISNLLSNAIKFTKEGIISVSKERRKGGGRVTTNTDYNYRTRNNGDAGNDIVIGIKDTGVGIDPEILPRLFTKFTTKSETGGTGLGLFISKSIVEAHGGKIWAQNNSDGKGCSFYISLPLDI